MRLVFHGASRQEGGADLRAGRAWTKESKAVAVTIEDHPLVCRGWLATFSRTSPTVILLCAP